jgi:putative restriction endonuclease
MEREKADIAIRREGFQWLDSQVGIHGDVLPRSILQQGYIFQGNQIRLLGPQGIFKPRAMELPLSITTVPSGLFNYNDKISHDGNLTYHYRGTDPNHRDNVGLRRAMQIGAPLIYFFRIMPGKYMATWPVFIVADNSSNFTFSVAVDKVQKGDLSAIDNVNEAVSRQPEDVFRRSYALREFRQRLHQGAFRERVLLAYRDQCALCRLRHRELLDAAHIIPDNEPGGEPIVKNGISLCKLHHAAFDKFFLGIRPDGIVIVRKDLLLESDGPMLRHGLQGLHNKKILLPRKTEFQPSPDLLERRWNHFQEVV